MNYTEFEQVPRLAEEIRAAVAEANLDYEVLIAGLYDERLKTLRKKYPDFAAQYGNMPKASHCVRAAS
jgi:hypothetical protein